MAITINSQAGNYSSMHEPLYFVVSSTNTAQSSFKYVCDIYINGNLVTRLKSFPQPTSSKGIFDVSSVVRNYWASYFKPNVTTPTAFSYVGSDIYINYVLKFGEEYGGTTYTNLAEASKFAYNHYYDYLRNGYFGSTGLASLVGTFITNRDKTQLLFDKNKLTTQRMFVSYLASEANKNFEFKLEITAYNGNTSTVYTGAIITNKDFVLLDISPTAINEYLGTSAITSSIVYYDVKLIETDITRDTVRVNLDCFPRSTSYNLHFLNALGGYDTMLFPLANKQSRSGNKKMFSSSEYLYNSNTYAMDRENSFGVLYGGNTQFWTEQSVSMKLISNWVNQTDYAWLKEAIFSSEVYLEADGNTFLPVTITDSNWVEKRNFQDKQFNLELNIELASKVNSQYR